MDEYSLSAPHNLEAEHSVLGAMLLDPKCVPEVITYLRADDFWSGRNRDLYRLIYSMFSTGQAIDQVTVLAKLQEQGDYDDETRRYVGELLELVPTSANVLLYAEIVRDRSRQRRIGEIGSELRRRAMEGYDTAEALLESAEQSLFELRNGAEVSALVPAVRVVDDAFKYLEEQEENARLGKTAGLTTGISPIDRQIGGLINSNVILMAARPGVGKTSIALNIAQTASKSGKTVVFFSLEMPLHQLGLRILSSESLIESTRLRDGNIRDDEWKKLKDAAVRISRLNLMFSESAAITVGEMKAMCRRVPDLGLIVIDYLQLMQSGRRIDNRTQEVGEISRALKIMAKELKVPVLCLAQLNRDVEKRKDKRPILSDLRESGAIEQDADVVMFLHRDVDGEDPQESDVVECIIAKNRHGAPGSVKLHWSGGTTTFTALSYENE